MTISGTLAWWGFVIIVVAIYTLKKAITRWWNRRKQRRAMQHKDRSTQSSGTSGGDSGDIDTSGLTWSGPRWRADSNEAPTVGRMADSGNFIPGGHISTPARGAFVRGGVIEDNGGFETGGRITDDGGDSGDSGGDGGGDGGGD